MENKLSVEEVKHVAKLARIGLDDAEIPSYQIELKQILNEIEKMNNVLNNDNEFLISPVDFECPLREDKVGDMLDIVTVMKNVPHKNGNYIEVPVVINE